MRVMCRERLGDAARSARRQAGKREKFAASSPTMLSLALGMIVTRGWTTATAAGQAVGCSATTRTRSHSGLHAVFVAPAGSTSSGYSTSTTADRVQLLLCRDCRSIHSSRQSCSVKKLGSRRPHCSGVDGARRCLEGGKVKGSQSLSCVDHDAASLEKKRAALGSSAGRDTPGPKLLRLSKILADRAIGTRTEVATMVRQGRIKVDGSVVKSPKTKLPSDCVIEVNGEPCGPVPLLVAFHKPKGVITSVSDEWNREDLSHVLPKALLRRHHPVGRLDGDSSGLLLLSSDGTLTHRLLNPRFGVEREYVATVDVSKAGEEPGEALVMALRRGVQTADGVYEADVREIEGRSVRLVVREGKNRMVRRILANAGYPVLELRRERYGKIILGDLAEGRHEPISGEALAWAGFILDGGSEGGEREEGERQTKPRNR